MSRANVANEATIVTPEILEQCLETYPVVADFNPVVPSADQRANDPPEGKVALYWKAITVGNFRFPLTEFQTQVFTHYCIGFPQLHPHSWQKLICFEMFFRGQGLPCLINVFRAVFRLSQSGTGWYNFEKKRDNNFCTSRSPSLHDWRDFYIFVDQSMLPEHYPRLLVWQYQRPTNTSKTPQLDAQERQLFALCREALLEMRAYPDVVLKLGGVSAYWPREEIVTEIVDQGRGMLGFFIT